MFPSRRGSSGVMQEHPPPRSNQTRVLTDLYKDAFVASQSVVPCPSPHVNRNNASMASSSLRSKSASVSTTHASGSTTSRSTFRDTGTVGKEGTVDGARLSDRSESKFRIVGMADHPSSNTTSSAASGSRGQKQRNRQQKSDSTKARRRPTIIAATPRSPAVTRAPTRSRMSGSTKSSSSSPKLSKVSTLSTASSSLPTTSTAQSPRSSPRSTKSDSRRSFHKKSRDEERQTASYHDRSSQQTKRDQPFSSFFKTFIRDDPRKKSPKKNVPRSPHSRRSKLSTSSPTSAVRGCKSRRNESVANETSVKPQMARHSASVAKRRVYTAEDDSRTIVSGDPYGGTVATAAETDVGTISTVTDRGSGKHKSIVDVASTYFRGGDEDTVDSLGMLLSWACNPTSQDALGIFPSSSSSTGESSVTAMGQWHGGANCAS